MPRPSFNVLIVDDNEALAGAIDRWTPDRHETTLVHSGAEARKSVQSNNYDAILLDKNLGDETGFDVLETIERYGSNPFVTMLTSQHPGFEVLDKPLDGYLTKPVTGDDVQGMISRFESLANASETAQRAAANIALYHAVEQSKHDSELEGSDRFQKLAANYDKYTDHIGDWLDDPTHGLLFVD